MKKYTERIVLSELFDNSLDEVIKQLQNLKDSHPNAEYIYVNYDVGYDYESPSITVEYIEKIK